jgi:hypothetical protein
MDRFYCLERAKENQAMANVSSTIESLGRVKVREIAGVFRSHAALDAAVGALLSSGFDRADLGV